MNWFKEFKEFTKTTDRTWSYGISKILHSAYYQDKFKPRKTRGVPKSPLYIRFITDQKCLICGKKQNRDIILAVYFDNKGRQVKKERSSDYSALPICKTCYYKHPEKMFFLTPEKVFALRSAYNQLYLRCIEGT